MDFKQDDFLKLVAPNGDYRYGYVVNVQEEGAHVLVCTHEEGDTKIAFEEEEGKFSGVAVRDWDRDLTQKQKEVISHLAENLKTREIAHRIGVSQSTVRGHIRLLKLKLGVQDKIQLGIYARGIEKHFKSRQRSD